MNNDDDMPEAIAAAHFERDSWSEYEFRYGGTLPVLTCGGIGVNYTVDNDGRIIFA